MKKRKIFASSEEELFESLVGKLTSLGYKPVQSFSTANWEDCVPTYLYAEGEIPLCLTAHLDTALPRYRDHQIYHDRAKGVWWSPDGLGADDRAGVIGVVKTLEAGYRPSVLFLNGEERGCWGAAIATKEIRPEVNALIALDRQGWGEAVFYDCGNEEFKMWVLAAGFKEARGLFSDISVLGPAWNLAAVNLSVGYYSAHWEGEYWIEQDLRETLLGLEKLLADPPAGRLPHCTLPAPFHRVYRVGGLLGYRERYDKCAWCGRLLSEDELVPLGADESVCPECLDQLVGKAGDKADFGSCACCDEQDALFPLLGEGVCLSCYAMLSEG